jgi:biopolymer transport protein ExbD
MALGKTRRRSQRFIPPKLQITSMMDMLTIILIFLLFSFSDTPETLTLDKDLQLPTSTARLDYKDTIKMVLSQKNLKLGDEVIAHLKGGEIIGLDPDRPKDSILYQRLKSYREKEQAGRADEGPKPTILFLCDKHLSFNTINRIIKTSGMAGYPNFQFGVLKK